VAESKEFATALFVIMFFLWLSWFLMNFVDPYKMNLPAWLRYIGLALFIIGFVFFIISHMKIKGQESGKLATSGIYSKIRHPMYFGFIIWLIGLPIFTNAAFTLASVVIWIPQILYWRASEERQLEKEHEDYQEYKKKTWF